MIVVENLHRHFGGFRAVDGASLKIETGSITGLIGPNGAGKTTLFNVIAGRLPPTSGRVLMDGEDISGLPPHELFAKGLLRTFQIAHEFGSMTVRENLMMVPADQSGESLWNACFRRGAVAAEERRLREKADEVLEFLTISHLADQRAAQISGGQKKLLELGRTMMVDAKMVFLDEVGAGVNRTLLNTIGDAIVRPSSSNFFCPPEMFDARWLARCEIVRNSSTSSALSRRRFSSAATAPRRNHVLTSVSPSWFSGTIIRFSRTVIEPNSWAI